MSNRRKILLVAWACMLAFGIAFQAETAVAAHNGCDGACGNCPTGECDYSMDTDCGGCVYMCAGSSTVKRTICVI